MTCSEELIVPLTCSEEHMSNAGELYLVVMMETRHHGGGSLFRWVEHARPY